MAWMHLSSFSDSKKDKAYPKNLDTKGRILHLFQIVLISSENNVVSLRIVQLGSNKVLV